MKIINYFLSLLAVGGLHPYLYSQTTIVQNLTITQQQVFANIDTLFIQNCQFTNINGEAIRFSGIDYVEISNCSFTNISNTIPTRAVICGKSTSKVLLKNLDLQNISGTAIRIPFDGTALLSDRVGSVIIDSVNIYNCQSTTSLLGDAIRIFHTDSLFVSNSTLKKIDNMGIDIGRNSSTTQTAQRVIYCHINNNQIDSVLADGIGAKENIDFALIENNTITNIAYDGIGARPAEGDHGIYWQAPHAVIRNNFISQVKDGLVSGNYGLGISLRTNATITNNTVSHCTGGGIGYFNDHPSNGNIFIANNVVYDCMSQGIYMNGSNGNILNPNSVSHPDSVFIFHNTVLNEPIQTPMHLSAPITFNNMTSKNYLAGNILIFATVMDTTKHIFTTNTSHLVKQYNHLVSGDINFEDYPNRILQLTSSSSAVDLLPFGTTFVSHDILNNHRTEPHDAGAYEFMPFVTGLDIFPTKLHNIQFFPNPSKGQLHFKSSQIVIKLNVYDCLGRLIETIKMDNTQGKIQIEPTSNIFIIQIVFIDGTIAITKVYIE